MRFKFGKNWLNYLDKVSEEKIDLAKKHLSSFLSVDDLRGKSFIDIGSGSGIMSLAASRLGADVKSFDYDANSVEATKRIRERFYVPGSSVWEVEQGSILDDEYIGSLGKFDVVYSWGVLHHTGQMWKAIDAAAGLAGPNALFYIAIYNDQGFISRFWYAVKYLYNLNAVTRFLISLIFIPYFYAIAMAADIIRLRSPFYSISRYDKIGLRGMSFYHDIIDWIGGYPFEYCGAGEIFSHMKTKGFSLQNMMTTSSMGCNEFVFIKKY